MDEQIARALESTSRACLYAYSREGVTEFFSAPTVRELMEIVEKTTEHNRLIEEGSAADTEGQS